MELVLATRNRDKIKEIRHILEGLDATILTLDDFPPAPEPVEDGETLEANALKKARAVRANTGRSAMADDTGLFVAALDGAPGVHAARYAGPEQSYEANTAKLLAAMEGVPDGRRAVEFRTVIAVALAGDDAREAKKQIAAVPESRFATKLGKDGEVDAVVAEGILHGEITREKRGQGGFGYDPVFWVPARGCTLAQMSAAEKNEISHRYRALVETRALLLRLGLASEAK
jgi:XTP/dITP diphosphohydrolase